MGNKKCSYEITQSLNKINVYNQLGEQLAESLIHLPLKI
jgi:hypothetical protein